MEKVNPHKLLVEANNAPRHTQSSRDLYLRASIAFEETATKLKPKQLKLRHNPLLRAADCATQAGDMERAGRLLLAAHEDGVKVKSYDPHLLLQHGLLLRKDRNPNANRFIELAMDWYLSQADITRALPLLIGVAKMADKNGAQHIRDRLLLGASQLCRQRAEEKGAQAQSTAVQPQIVMLNYTKALQYARAAGAKEAEAEIAGRMREKNIAVPAPLRTNIIH